MKILAIDQATKSGWAITPEMSGVWDCSIKRDESAGMRLIRFRAKLQEIYISEKPDLIVYERTAGFHRGALVVSAQLVGVIQLFCEDNKIEHRAYSAGEIKKHATGKGNANKDKMVEAANLKWGFKSTAYPSVNIIDDNHADALHLLDLAHKDLMV
jgi:Holliday junction resolvasome RuvABC endonuclease subunit